MCDIICNALGVNIVHAILSHAQLHEVTVGLQKSLLYPISKFKYFALSTDHLR